MRVIVNMAKPSVGRKRLPISTGICCEDFFGSNGAICFAKAGHLAISIGYVESRCIYPASFVITAVLSSTRIQGRWIEAVFIHVGVAIKLIRMELHREPGGRCSRQRHFTIRMPHSPALMFGLALFAE